MMNQGQEQFYSFILERVQEEKREEAKALLLEGFEKQADGTFGPDYMQGYSLKMLAMLTPEHVEEVRGIMAQFGGAKA